MIGLIKYNNDVILAYNIDVSFVFSSTLIYALRTKLGDNDIVQYLYIKSLFMVFFLLGC